MSKDDILMSAERFGGALETFELPQKTKLAVFSYFESKGKYARANDMLFEMIETGEDLVDAGVVGQGRVFYERLRSKSDTELETGGISREKVEQSLAQLEEKG